MKLLSKKLLLTIILTVGFFIPNASIASDNTNASAEKIFFNSYTPKNATELVKLQKAPLPDVEIFGTLLTPRTHAEKMPAMVIIHGSAGISDREFSLWGRLLNDMGIAAFIVDSFTPRNIKSTVQDQFQVSDYASVADALSALKILSHRSDIDTNRIGVMGFSKGGTVSLQTLWEPFRKSIIDDDVKFAAHIPFFPACVRQPWSRSVSAAPVLLLLGEKDDYTRYEPCIQYAERIKNLGGNITTKVYSNAYHAFEADLGSFTWNPRIQNFSTCPTVEAEIGVWRWQLADVQSTADQVDATGNIPNKSCWSRGAHTGNNPASSAREDSQKDVRAFLGKVFGLPDKNAP